MREREDRLVTEEPLEIRLGWPGHAPTRLSVTMRTPGDDFELVAGFLLGERIIESASDLHTISYCIDRTLTPEQQWNVVTAQLTGPPRHSPALRFDGYTASACGVCGKQSIEAVLETGSGPDLRDRWSGRSVAAEVLTGLPDRLRERQRVFGDTGGLHAAGLFDADGSPAVVREDVGRHNAVDKVVGSLLLSDDGPWEQQVEHLPVLCVSGRIGFELVQKAVRAEMSLIAAVGAPSSLAVDLASEAGLCVVGFVRNGRFVVYTVPERVGV